MIKITCLALALTLVSIPALAKDDRYLPPEVEIARNTDGSIKRSNSVKLAFRAEHPCPVTMKTTGACPNYEIDHVIPLACRGKDIVENMQWLPSAIKSSANPLAKDRWERLGTTYCK